MASVHPPLRPRNLSTNEEAELNDIGHPLDCDCPACLPEAHDGGPVAIDAQGSPEAA